MDLEVEDELLVQDPPFRQHKHETGNYREEIIVLFPQATILRHTSIIFFLPVVFPMF